MTIAHLLEDFGRGLAAKFMDPTVPSAELTETMRLEAYEDGYKAGWDDAIDANQAEQMQVAADLAQNLRDLSFTYQEASAHVSKSLSGVLEGMMGHFLPETARLALAPKLVEEVKRLPIGAENMQIVLSAAPDNLSVLERVLGHIPDANVKLMQDGSLTGGQVVIGFEDSEVSIDFDALLDDMRAALAAFSPDTQKELING